MRVFAYHFDSFNQGKQYIDKGDLQTYEKAFCHLEQ